MEINKNISPEGEATLDIAVPAVDIGAVFTDAISRFRREVNIPGFRPGRVPLDLIRRRWGREIMSEKADELARDFLARAVKQESLKPAGIVNIELIEYGEEKPLHFKAVFPLAPDVKLTHYKGLKVVVNDVEISDTDIDNELEALRRKHALMKSIDDPAPPEARLTLKVQDVDPSGLQLIGRPVEEKVIEFGMDELGVGSDEQLLGIRAGEKRIIRTRQDAGTLSMAPVQPHIVTPGQKDDLDFGTDERYLSVEAEKVEIAELPELNDDFARSVDDAIDSLKTLRELIRFKIMSYVESARRQMLEKAITDRLLEENPFQISKGLIASTLKQIAANVSISEDDRDEFIEQHRQEAEADLRWVELRNEIARVEEITVTDEMVESELRRYAEQSGEPVEKIRKKIETEGGIESLRKRMIDRDVMDFLITNADIEKRTMNLDEFFRLSRSQLEE